MKPLLFLDLDRTLFHTEQMKAEITQQLWECIGDETAILQFWEQEKKFRGRPHYLHHTIEHFITQHPHVDAQQLFALFFHKDFSQYVYPDVVEVIPKLAQQYRLEIFSTGDVEFQMQKIQHSSIFPHFSAVSIFPDKMQYLDVIRDASVQTEVWYIDDVVEFLTQAKQTVPSLHTVWCNRERVSLSTPEKPESECADFYQLSALFS